MNKLDKASKTLTDTFIQSVQEGGGSPVEADSALNNLSREVILVMHETHGEIWLGQINIYGYKKGMPIICKWDGDRSKLYNFGADFVLPRFDETLESLIRDWNEKGASAKLYDTIYDRVNEVGGQTLHWS